MICLQKGTKVFKLWKTSKGAKSTRSFNGHCSFIETTVHFYSCFQHTGRQYLEHSAALQLSSPRNIRTFGKTTKSSTSPSKQCQQLIEKKNSSDGSVKRQKPPRTVLRTSLYSQTTQSRITVACKKRALEPIQPSKISGIV